MRPPRQAGEALDQARLLWARGENQAALAALDGLRIEDREACDALVLKAALLLEIGAEDAALELLDRATRLWPDSVEARNARARRLHALGRNQEALLEAERARALLADTAWSDAAGVYLTLVWVLRDLRRYREALRHAEEGLRRTPDAVLAEWAEVVEQELQEAERERC